MIKLTKYQEAELKKFIDDTGNKYGVNAHPLQHSGCLNGFGIGNPHNDYVLFFDSSLFEKYYSYNLRANIKNAMPRGIAFLFIGIVMVNYFVGKIEVQLFTGYSHYVIVVDGTIDKILQPLNLALVLFHLLLKCFLFPLQLAIPHKPRYKRRY